jgi:methylase of polypeptide subunit release factors
MQDELDRMDLEHHIFGLVVGQLHLAPLKSPQKILDLGTGTGLWAIDAADKYPSAEVIGTDLSPTQPKWY